MPTLIELKDKRNKLMADATAVVRKEGKFTPEDKAKADAILAEVDVLEQQIEVESRVGRFEDEQRSHVPPPRAQPGAEARDDSADAKKKRERRAFEAYVKYGIHDHVNLRSTVDVAALAAEYRDLGVGTVSGSITGGAQFVPQAFYPLLTEAQKAWGQILTIVNEKRTDTGASMKYALLNDTGNGLVEIGETVAPAETDPTITGAISNTSIVTTGILKVTLPELQDSAFDLDSWIRNGFGMRYMRGAANMVTNGSTSGNVQSIVTTATTGYTTASDTAVGYADIAGLYAALDPAYMANAKFTMNSNTRGKLLQVEDSLGRPLFIPAPSAEAFDQLLGRPVVINQMLANVPAVKGAAIVPIQFGDFKQGYTYRIAQDLAIVRLNERFMDQLEVGFIGYARIGGFATDAGTHPILNLVMADV